MKPILFAFDFDGTLTKKDTFGKFIVFACGYRKCFVGLLLHFLPIIKMLLHRESSSRVKEQLFTHFFAGMPLSDFDALCRDFAASQPGLIRDGAREALKSACEQGVALIVSASVENWIRPFFSSLPLCVISTKIEVSADGFLTGRFLGANCRGEEKVRRILKQFPNRADYILVAYGDSGGDRELLAFADEAHFKPFRTHLFSEAVRFCVTGGIAVLVQYVSYRLLLPLFSAVCSYAIAYAVSLSVNLMLSAFFTFKVRLTTQKIAGFLFSHALNFTMQTTLLYLLVFLGFKKVYAPIPVYAVCVPVNFLLVRHFLKNKTSVGDKNDTSE